MTLGDRPSDLSSRAPGGEGPCACTSVGGAQGWSLLWPPLEAEAPSFLHTVLSGHGACRGSQISDQCHCHVSRQRQAVFVEEPPCAPHWRLPASVSPSFSDPVAFCP